MVIIYIDKPLFCHSRNAIIACLKIGDIRYNIQQLKVTMSQFKFKLIITFYSELKIISLAGI